MSEHPKGAGWGGDLTVVIPNYNHGPLITGALDSVFGQKRPPEVVLVIDDASTDDSMDVIEAYARRHRSIQVLQNPANRGVVFTINRGLQACRSEYVTFLAADDVAHPRLYGSTRAMLDAHPAAALCTVANLWTDEEGQVLPQPGPPPLGPAPRFLSPGETIDGLARWGSFLNGTGAVYRTRALQEVGGFAPELGPFCDGYIMQVLAASHGCCYLPEPLAVWRRSPKSYSGRIYRDLPAARAVLQALEQRLEKDAGIFPEGYRNRLLDRMRFDVLHAAIARRDIASSEIADILGADRTTGCRLLYAVRTRLGYTPGLAVLALLLRPRDLVWALRRRLPHHRRLARRDATGAWSSGSAQSLP